MKAGRATTISRAISGRFALWAGIAIGVVLLQHVVQLTALTVTFGNFPNYWTGYNWPKNLWTIFSSTPSLSDSLSIAADEWLLEAGYMNRDFGRGIAEWAFSVMPSKILVVLALGFLVATVFVLLLDQRRGSGSGLRRSIVSLAAAGALLVAFTSASMHWVGACAEPSWVVGLTMVGLNVPLALWLEPAGPWLSAAGFLLLVLAVILAAAPEKTFAARGARGLAIGNPYGP
ncbi:hypothetical protein [Chelativorans xinjiangense]|uniref:hypothetical protein n=1 Tax=Chelativorans xinjiangense TaxID=2681485 RepID=UPI001357E252|nr:hypothetical protein [Chelativorans xinjiangense]